MSDGKKKNNNEWSVNLYKVKKLVKRAETHVDEYDALVGYTEIV